MFLNIVVPILYRVTSAALVISRKDFWLGEGNLTAKVPLTVCQQSSAVDTELDVYCKELCCPHNNAGMEGEEGEVLQLSLMLLIWLKLQDQFGQTNS